MPSGHHACVEQSSSCPGRVEAVSADLRGDRKMSVAQARRGDDQVGAAGRGRIFGAKIIWKENNSASRPTPSRREHDKHALVVPRTRGGAIFQRETEHPEVHRWSNTTILAVMW